METVRSSGSQRVALVMVCLAVAACARAETGPSQPTATFIPATVTPTATSEPTPTAIPLSDGEFLEKPEGSFRVVSYNVNWDSIFSADDPQNHDLRGYDRTQSFPRIMRALAPDILCLQEINPDRDAADVAEFLDGILDAEGEESWSAVIVRDTLIATRFDLRVDGYTMEVSRNIPNLAQAAALVDLPNEAYATDLYVICTHFKAGGGIDDERMRGRQADVLMSQVRDAVTPGGRLDLPTGTPIVVLGDFNAYESDPIANLTTLIEGDISNETVYGQDFAPDWDGTGFADAGPSHNAVGAEFYTWRNDAEPFLPGSLDHIFFSDGVLTAMNTFILDTTQISQQALDEGGLLAGDVLLVPELLYFDHLPLVIDFLPTGD